MAVDFIQDCSLLVGAIEVAGNAKSANLATTVAPLDTTPMSTTGWTTLIGGNKSGSVDITFMSDFVNAGLDDVLWSYLATADVPKSFVRGTADGSLAYLWRGIPLSYVPVEGAPGELAMGRISGQSSTGPVIRGKLLHPGGTARTTSSAGTARQLGALSATQRLHAALHVLSVSGSATPTLTVKVQSDNAEGFPSATDRITYTGATAVGYQWSSVDGAVTDDWWRVSWTISGTSPSFLFAVTAGIVTI
jgi:hypothetical protein